MSELNKDKLLCGVKCMVENCVHHTPSNGCNASGITVGGHDANAVKETGCETFTKKGCCN